MNTPHYMTSCSFVGAYFFSPDFILYYFLFWGEFFWVHDRLLCLSCHLSQIAGVVVAFSTKNGLFSLTTLNSGFIFAMSKGKTDDNINRKEIITN